MSRGPGRIERAIYDLFEGHPEGAWTTEDLCRLVYPAADRIEKKHRVAVVRAMKTILAKTGDQHRDWTCWQAATTGSTLVLFNNANVMSYGLARLKTDNYPRYVCTPHSNSWLQKTEDELKAFLEPGGKDHGRVVPGGAWDQHVRMYIAERDGDQETAQKLAAEQERRLAAIFSKKLGNS